MVSLQLGLILGTRMYYKFDPSAVATDTEFSERMDAVTRELGLRGLCEAISESVPPSKTQAQAPVYASDKVPALEPVPAPAPEPTPAPASVAAISQRGLTGAAISPSSQQQLSTGSLAVQQSTAGAAGGGGAMDVSTFLDLVDRVQAKVDAERRATESIIEQFRAERQITSLQRRLAALHALGLLELDELCTLEDVVEDSLDAADSTASGADDRALRMVAMSTRTAVDANFARQLRRKFLS